MFSWKLLLVRTICSLCKYTFQRVTFSCRFGQLCFQIRLVVKESVAIESLFVLCPTEIPFAADSEDGDEDEVEVNRSTEIRNCDFCNLNRSTSPSRMTSTRRSGNTCLRRGCSGGCLASRLVNGRVTSLYSESESLF